MVESSTPLGERFPFSKVHSALFVVGLRTREVVPFVTLLPKLVTAERCVRWPIPGLDEWVEHFEVKSKEADIVRHFEDASRRSHSFDL